LKVKKHDAYIQIKLPSALKEKAEKKLTDIGYPMAEFIREKLKEIVGEENEEG